MSIRLPNEDGFYEEVVVPLGGTPIDTSTGYGVAGQDAQAPGTGDGKSDPLGDFGRSVRGIFDGAIGLYKDYRTTELEFERLQSKQRQPDLPTVAYVNASRDGGTPADSRGVNVGQIVLWGGLGLLVLGLVVAVARK